MDVWWFPTIFYIKIWNHPIETTIYTCFLFEVPGISEFPIGSICMDLLFIYPTASSGFTHKSFHLSPPRALHPWGETNPTWYTQWHTSTTASVIEGFQVRKGGEGKLTAKPESWSRRNPKRSEAAGEDRLPIIYFSGAISLAVFFCIGGWYIFLGPFFVNCVFSWEKRKISDEWKKISESYNMMILPTNSSGLGCFSNVEKCWDDSPYHFSFSLPKKCWSQCLGWFSPYQYDRPPGRFTWFTREIQKRPLGRGVIFSSKPNHHGIRFQWFIFRGVQ